MAIKFNIGNGAGNAHVNDQGAHQQSITELTANLKKLADEYKATHPVVAGNRLAKKLRDEKAEKYAIEQEPTRDIAYLLEQMKGVKADTQPRNVDGKQFKATSSLVESVTRVAPNLVSVRMNGKEYLYGGSADDVERFLTSPSLGAEINKARKDQSSTIKALYHTK